MMLLYSTARVLARTIAPCPAASFSRVNTRPLCAYESTSVGSWRPYTSTSTFQPLSHKTQPTSRVCPPLPVVVRAYGSDGKGDYSGGVSLVQGASRGIGLEFVRQLLQKHPKGHVVAACRTPRAAEELTALVNDSHGRLTAVQIDVTDEDTIAAAAKSIKDTFGRLDLMVNATGVLHLPSGIQPETSLAKVTPEALMLTYQINAMGPILMTKHMAPLLKAGGGRGTGREGAVIANLSARVGSIGDNSMGGWYSYRASKTALNQLTKTASLELSRKRDPIVSILLHPGTVDTDLSKPFQRNVSEGKLFTKEYSVQRLLSIIDGLKMSDNGKFFAWDGEEIIW